MSEQAVLDVIRRFARAFTDRDTDAFMSLWDAEYGDRIVYQPEELCEAVHGREEVRRYFEHVPSVVVAIRDVKPVDLKIEVLGELALVHNRFWCRLALHRNPFVYDGQVRQTFVLRQRDGAWHLLHYHESRQSPGFAEAVGSW
jgi:uncharacterized protein (TIGR02246 family)